MPVTAAQPRKNKEVKKKSVRPLPDSQVEKFGACLVREQWEFLTPENMSSTELVQLFQDYTSNIASSREKIVTVTAYDKPYVTYAQTETESLLEKWKM